MATIEEIKNNMVPETEINEADVLIKKTPILNIHSKRGNAKLRLSLAITKCKSFNKEAESHIVSQTNNSGIKRIEKWATLKKKVKNEFYETLENFKKINQEEVTLIEKIIENMIPENVLKVEENRLKNINAEKKFNPEYIIEIQGYIKAVTACRTFNKAAYVFIEIFKKNGAEICPDFLEDWLSELEFAKNNFYAASNEVTLQNLNTKLEPTGK